MKVLFLLFSAITVSADSFFVGLSLYNRSKDYKGVLIGVLSAVFCLCLLGATVGFLIPEKFANFANFLAGCCLIIIAINELNKTKIFVNMLAFEESLLNLSLIGGVSIGIDGFIGSLTLVLLNYNPLLVALLITLTHGLLLCLSFWASNKLNQFYRLEKLPYFLLLGLGTIKVLDYLL